MTFFTKFGGVYKHIFSNFYNDDFETFNIKYWGLGGEGGTLRKFLQFWVQLTFYGGGGGN